MALDIVLTVVARDRPGLVQRLSEVVSAHSGNWIDSSMARLGGEFAGILRIAIPEQNSAEFEAALTKLADQDIAITMRRNTEVQPPTGTRARLTLTGIDHPGIVHRVASILASRHVSIDELETEVFTGSMSAEQLFAAKATIVIPSSLEESTLRADLEQLAQDIMVEIELTDGNG